MRSLERARAAGDFLFLFRLHVFNQSKNETRAIIMIGSTLSHIGIRICTLMSTAVVRRDYYLTP